jgi:hypothetical protein
MAERGLTSPGKWRTAALSLALLWIISAIFPHASAQAGNIFEDDWTPPAPRKVAPPPVDNPAVKPTPPATGTPASTLPPAPKITPPVASPRRAIPDKAEQAKSRKLFKEVFAKELADKSPAARRALAGRLLEEASKSAGIPTDQFVLLFGATEAGREGSDLALCIQAVDLMTDSFEVDGLQFKVETALKMSLKADSPFTSSQNGWAGLALMDQLIAAEDYVAVAQLSTALRPPAATDPALSLQLQNRTKEVDARRVGAERIAKDLAKLKTAPDDPVANLAVGKFLCFTKGDWTVGLPMLAKGSDAKLQQLAKQELAKQADKEAIAALGDAWWEVAATQRDVSHAKIVQHAVGFYQLALESSSGLRRAAMEKRIAEGAALFGHRVVNLMPLIDIDKDVVSGTWRLSNGQPTSGTGRFDRVRIPYEPPQEYDFHVEFTRVGSADVVCQILSHSGHDFSYINGANGNTASGFERIDGRGASDGKTAVRLNPTQDKGVRHSSVIKVRQHSISAYVDGKLMADYSTDFSELTLHNEFNIGGGALGVGSLCPTTFHVIEVVEVTGTGKQLPHRK